MTLPRPQRPGSVHGMISDTLDACDRSAVEAELSISKSMMSRWADPCEENGRRMHVATLDTIGRLFPEGAAVIARHFAPLAGGSFVPFARGAALSPHGALAELGKRVADAAAELLAATDPAGPHGSDLSPAEIVAARAKVSAVADAVAALDAALAAAQDGGRR